MKHFRSAQRTAAAVHWLSTIGGHKPEAPRLPSQTIKAANAEPIGLSAHRVVARLERGVGHAFSLLAFGARAAPARDRVGGAALAGSWRAMLPRRPLRHSNGSARSGTRSTSIRLWASGVSSPRPRSGGARQRGSAWKTNGPTGDCQRSTRTRSRLCRGLDASPISSSASEASRTDVARVARVAGRSGPRGAPERNPRPFASLSDRRCSMPLRAADDRCPRILRKLVQGVMSSGAVWSCRRWRPTHDERVRVTTTFDRSKHMCARMQDLPNRN
jgi:hypothetical protein